MLQTTLTKLCITSQTGLGFQMYDIFTQIRIYVIKKILKRAYRRASVTTTHVSFIKLLFTFFFVR